MSHEDFLNEFSYLTETDLSMLALRSQLTGNASLKHSTRETPF